MEFIATSFETIRLLPATLAWIGDSVERRARVLEAAELLSMLAFRNDRQLKEI
jgi:hypothetical protein